ncbi:hypothetical protein D3C72_2241720 [compost metagenome]
MTCHQITSIRKPHIHQARRSMANSSDNAIIVFINFGGDSLQLLIFGQIKHRPMTTDEKNPDVFFGTNLIGM